jgi:hypothetical protein
MWIDHRGSLLTSRDSHAVRRSEVHTITVETVKQSKELRFKISPSGKGESVESQDFFSPDDL